PDPQLKLQFAQQSLEPARMSTGLHPHAYLLSLGRQLTVELLRGLAVLQSPLLQFPAFGIHKSNLLKGRVVIASYNDHCSALQKLRCGSFDDLESELGGFAFEIANLQLAMLSVVKVGSSVDELHSVTQHAIDQSR